MGSWDDFQIVSELQEQNQHLILQLDSKDRELRELHSAFSKLKVSVSSPAPRTLIRVLPIPRPSCGRDSPS